MNLKLFSFFSGCGLLDLGFERAGYEIETVNEYYLPFLNAYKFSRKEMKIKSPKYGYFHCDISDFFESKKEDLKNIIKKEKDMKSLIGFIGGPPCPDFSIAGKQKGKNGKNGRLSLLYIQLIIEISPDFFIFENVKGLWSTSKHREFYNELKQKLEKADYIMTDHLTNSIEYGTPQDRDRIILFGIKRSVATLNGLEINNFPWKKYIKFDKNEIKNLDWPVEDKFEIDTVKKIPPGLPEELTVEYWFKKNDVDNHPNGKKFFTPRAGLTKMLTINEGDVSRKSYKRIHRWRYSPTAAYGNNEVHLHPYKPRRLSVSECLAIQSLPKEFSLPPDMSLSDSFKTIGNGVPFLLAYGVARTIKDFLEKNGFKRRR